MKPHTDPSLQKRFILSLGLTFGIFLLQVIGGLWTGSLALLSDSAHVFTDLFALGLSFAALRLSGLPPNDRHSYGYHRLEVLAALVNGLSLVIIAAGISREAYHRFVAPEAVRSLEMMGIAAVGLVVNLWVALVLGGHKHEGEEGLHFHQDLNLRSAFLHVVGDAVSSVGVILAAIIITFTGWLWVDPLVSVLIAALILVSAYRLIRSSLHILIEGVPEGLSISAVGERIHRIPAVESIHDLHVWSLCSSHVALSAHVVLDTARITDTGEILGQIKSDLSQQFGIEHTTIQFESVPCTPGQGSCD